MRKSEEKYRMLFNSIDEGFCIIEVLFDDKELAYDYRFLETNSSFEKQTGLVNAVGKTARELSPGLEQFWFDIYGKIATTGKPARFEHVAEAMGYYYNVYAFSIDDPKKHHVAILFNDITEIKRAEERQIFLLQLSDSIRELTDAEEIKETACRVLGEQLNVTRVLYFEIVTNDEKKYFRVTGQYSIDIPFPAVLISAEKVHAGVSPYFEGKTSIATDVLKEIPVDEQESYLQFNIRAFVGVPLLKKGTPVLFLGVHDNKTRKWRKDELKLIEETAERTWAAVERAKAEKELEESEKQLWRIKARLELSAIELERKVEQRTAEINKQKNLIEAIINSTPDLVGAYDTETRIITFNKACEDVFNVKAEEVIGKRFDEVFPNGSQTQAEDDLKRALQGEVIYNKSFYSVVTGRDYENYIIPLLDENEKVYAAVAIAQDITDKSLYAKRLEAKNRELEKMNKELEAFTYASSHDLQEPLRKIQMFTGRIMDKDYERLSEKSKECFNFIRDAAVRMQTLIADLLSFSHLASSEREFEMVSLNDIMEEVKEEFGEIIELTQATIEHNVLCEINVIHFQFRQLMYNLVSNALKFTKPGVPPHIVIHCDKTKHLPSPPFKNQEGFIITFSDNGIGFDPQFSERVFELFQKLHSKDDYAGTGLGLAIVKKIVENHNGHITVESEPGKGTTFMIYLPSKVI